MCLHSIGATAFTTTVYKVVRPDRAPLYRAAYYAKKYTKGSVHTARVSKIKASARLLAGVFNYGIHVYVSFSKAHRARALSEKSETIVIKLQVKGSDLIATNGSEAVYKRVKVIS